ncbi:peptidase S51, partial [Streptococcus pneumoniae]
MKEQIFLMGGNPPIKNYTIVNKIVSSRKIERIVIFTVFRENWEPYMKKYTEVFQSQFPNLNIDYLLLDTEQIDLDSYLDADIIIIGGGNTEKYIATYVN